MKTITILHLAISLNILLNFIACESHDTKNNSHNKIHQENIKNTPPKTQQTTIPKDEPIIEQTSIPKDEPIIEQTSIPNNQYVNPQIAINHYYNGGALLCEKGTRLINSISHPQTLNIGGLVVQDSHMGGVTGFFLL